MKKILLIIPIVLIVSLIAIFIWSAMNNTGRKVILYDKRFASPGEFEVRSKSDLREIDRIISHLYSIEDNDSGELRVGGFMIIEIYEKGRIESYRVQGTNVTKYIYGESYDNLLSTSHYVLDDEYSQDLSNLCDKFKNKTK